jgi:hypothetical protein
MQPRRHVPDASEAIRLALDSAADRLQRVAALASCTTPSVIFLFAVSTRRYPASCRAAASKRHKLERCHVFATPVFLRSSPAIALEKSSPMSFGGPGARGRLLVSGPKPRRQEPTVTLDFALTIAKY